MLKKTLLSMFATALLSGVAFNALADDANQGSGNSHPAKCFEWLPGLSLSP